MYFESYADGLRNDLHDDDIRGITCLYGDEMCEEFQFSLNPAFSKFNLKTLFSLEGEHVERKVKRLSAFLNIKFIRFQKMKKLFQSS